MTFDRVVGMLLKTLAEALKAVEGLLAQRPAPPRP